MRLFIGLALLGATTGSVAYAQSYIEDGAIAARAKDRPAEVDYGLLVSDEIAAEASREPEAFAMESALRDADNALASTERLQRFRELVSHVSGLVPAEKAIKETIDDAVAASVRSSIPQPLERVELPASSVAQIEPAIAPSYEADIAALLEGYEEDGYGE